MPVKNDFQDEWENFKRRIEEINTERRKIFFPLLNNSEKSIHSKEKKLKSVQKNIILKNENTKSEKLNNNIEKNKIIKIKEPIKENISKNKNNSHISNKYIPKNIIEEEKNLKNELNKLIQEEENL